MSPRPTLASEPPVLDGDEARWHRNSLTTPGHGSFS